MHYELECCGKGWLLLEIVDGADTNLWTAKGSS